MASAAKKLLRERPGSGVACRSNSSNRWCASSGLSVPARTRSVAGAKAEWGDQERVVGEAEAGEQLRRSGWRRDQWRMRGTGGWWRRISSGGGGWWRRNVGGLAAEAVPRRAGAEARRREWLGRD
jgi:hypothetical protein